MMARYKYYIYAILIYILALGVHVYNEYKNEQKALYESIDKDLIQGARAVPIILKDDFHDQVLTSESISSDEDMQNIKKLSEFTKLTRLIYIYSFILDKDTVRFTSSSATPEELESNNGVSHYFDEYESATIKLKEAFINETIGFENIKDKWGTFRSVYISYKTKSGKIYVTGADIKIDFINQELNEIFFYTLLEALILLSILIPFFLAFRNISIKAKEELERTIQIRTEELHQGNLQLLEYKKAVDASAIVSKSDSSGRITYVNDAFCEISGFSRNELIGKSHNIVRSLDMDKSFYNDMWKTIQSKNIFKGIIKNIKKDGTFYYVATTIIPILNSHGEILEYLSLRYDITELVYAKEKAQIAEKAKSTFLANMSHEIRTPLNAIIGFSDILCESKLDKEDKEYAQIISRSAKSLLLIINDVLDISKIESGKLNIVNESFLFDPFIEHIIELFSMSAKEKEIVFIYNHDEKLPYKVLADATRLQQILSNLLSNAIKFTPKQGKVIFNIEVLEMSNENTKIKFSVKDTGIGMSPSQQKIVFNPFSQADDGISRKFGGTGLGLSICSDIAKMMGSNMELTSELGEGSEFSFVINLKVDILEYKDNTDKNNLVFEKSSNSNFEANILVAEDNPNNQRLIEILLSKIGVSYTVVNNGLEALRAYQNSKFNMVLMDINMPELDGVETTKELIRLQKEEALYKIPIIALTANSISGDREVYLEAGMDDYLSKPIEFEKLAKMIEKYLTKKTQMSLENSNIVTQENKIIKDTQALFEYKKSDAVKQLGLDESTVSMLIDNFFLTLEDDLNKLKKAVASKECNEIYKVAHYIKGSCSSLVMIEPSNLLHEIEKNAKNGICAEIDLTKVIQSFENIKECL